MTTDMFMENQISLLGPEYRAFVVSPFTEEMARSFGDSLSFSQRQVEILENAIFLFLTLIFSPEETRDFIVRNCDLPPSETELLWSAIEASLPDGMPALISAARNSLQGNTVPSPEAVPTSSLENEIAEAEHEFASLGGIRTMATDMRSQAGVPNGEVTYASSQTDILPTQTNRWESE